jgi:transcription elongation GreA/GreB family factor
MEQRMSRAFVKEDSDAPPPEPLGRAISTAPNKVTPRGLRLIGEEIARLETALAEEPPEEVAALLRRDLRYWSARSASAQPVAPEPDAQSVGFGALVTIRRGGTTSAVEIVGEDEADPAAGRIAWTSPLARALDEAEAGDIVELDAGGRIKQIAVVAVGTRHRPPNPVVASSQTPSSGVPKKRPAK